MIMPPTLHRSSPALVAATLALAACSGRVDTGPDPSGNTSSQATPGIPTVFGTVLPPPASRSGGPPPVAAQSCAGASKTPDNPSQFASSTELSGVLTRTWLYCGSTSSGPGASPLGDATIAGFQVTTDGAFYVLRTAADGGLVRHTGFDDEGRIVLVDTSAMNGTGAFQINFVHAGNGTSMSQPYVSQDEKTIAFVTEAGRSTFVATDAPVAVPDLPADGLHLGASGCAVEEGHTASTFASATDAQARLVARWAACPQTSLPRFGPDGNAGLELTNDGHFYFLQPDYSRGSGDPWTGTYQLVDTSSMNGPGVFQLNLNIANGTYILEWATSTAPVKLRVMNMGVQETTYSALP
jgi:hypothetical protein